MTTSPPTALRREAILPSDDRRRLGTMVAMCSLAGVAVGFGLSTAAMQAASEASRTVVLEQRSVELVPAGADVPWLGVRFRDARGQLDGLTQGAAIDRVICNTPAARAGFEVGDVVVRYDGRPVLSMSDFYTDVRSSEVGDQPTIDVVRDGHAVELHPTLGARYHR
ncbi:MAG: PDZ domain-containing protein [Deltaproteobacteria bacterium]|nr:PDZ domain-containing protein [Deltaproteobacteria bacterium]